MVLGPEPLGAHGAARPRIEAIAEAFAAAGWETDMVGAVAPQPAEESDRRWVAPAAAVRLATRLGIAGDIRPRQALAALERVRRLGPDTLLLVSVPPFSLVALTGVHPGPTLVDYRDVLSLASCPTTAGTLLGPWERRLLRRHAAGVSVAGSRRLVGEVVRGAGLPADRVLHVPNGVRREEVGVGTPPEDHGPVRVVFAGELYGYADFRPLSRAFAALPSDVAELHVVTPTDASTLRRYVGVGEPNVVVHPPMSRPDLYRFLRGCDLGLVALTRDYPYLDSVPAKYFDYLAAGLLVLYVGPEGPALLDEPGAERVLVAADPEHLSQLLLEQHARGGPRRPQPLLVDRAESSAALVRLAERLRSATD